MTPNDLLKQFRDAIDQAGGLYKVKARFIKAQIYFALASRIKKNEESVEFDARDVLGEKSYLVDICTKTGISRLRIPAFSCFELKSNPNADAIYQANKIGRLLKQAHPEAKMFLIYEDNVHLTKKVISEANKDNLIEVWELEAFLKHIESVKKINDQIDLLKRDWLEKRTYVLDNARWSFRENKCSLFLGAGVSIDAGGPSWDELLYKAIKKNKKTLVREILRRFLLHADNRLL